jgi:hypothetical protein
LLDFLGWDLTNDFVKMALVLVTFQLLVSFTYWRSPRLLHLATVSLLAFLLGAKAYGGSTHHFLWVSPLLTACLAVDFDETWIFILTFLTACLAPPIFSSGWLVSPYEITFTWGAFYAAKAIYLVQLNLKNIVGSHIHMTHFKRSSERPY